MTENKPHIAIAYDFDGTLAPGNMQEHSFIPELGLDKSEFWAESDSIARDHDADQILTYMQLMLEKAKGKGIPITRDALSEHGRKITFFKGVKTYFDRINAFAEAQGVFIEHYIISSGVREIIQGTSIAGYFKYIFASGFIFDKDRVAIWPALAINYTNKTQYLFRINKGIINSYDNSQINKFIPYEQRPIPFSRMIYVGDGETDVPAMKMIKYQGGKAIAVYDPGREKEQGQPSGKLLCEKLIEQHRADYMAAADYSENAKLDRILKSLIQIMAKTAYLQNL
ncbi:MAG: HAD family hydrolase [bacterium]|jgi:2-hydroxy-3-keto-5-methylthiopentenyl-1-phosphate phosphatase